MRARAAIGLALAGCVAAWPAAAHATPQHAGIQVALRALGLYCGPIDGDVGPQTVAAIRSVQRRANLPATGIADSRTRAVLGPLGGPYLGERVLRAGDFGLDVSVLEYLLLQRGVYDSALDGYLGARAVDAVQQFQHGAGLAIDGVVGPQTVAALLGESAAAAVIPTTRTYVIRAGDTLTAIAGRFDLSLADLSKVNGIDPARVILIGARLVIPTPALAATPADIRDRLDAWSTRTGLPQSLVRALAWMESGYQPKVVSVAGARGVLQTLPSTRDFVEQVLVGHSLPDTVDGDIEVGVLYLRHLLQRFDGDKALALAAWYQGEEAVRRHGVLTVTKPFVADVLALEGRM